MESSVAPSSVTSTRISDVSPKNGTKLDTIGKKEETMSGKTSSETPEVHQQTNEMVRNSQNRLQNKLYSYPLTKENIMYARVPGENPENVFICQPVNDSTQEVKQIEPSSLYGVEYVQILDSIAFDDDDSE